MRRSLWSVLLLVSGCAAFQHPDHKPKAVASLDRLKSDPKAACSSITDLGGVPWSVKEKEAKTTVGDKLIPTAVEACAHAAAGPDGADVASVDVTLIFPQQDERWRPEFWHLEVIRANGMVVQAGSLDGRVEDGVCVLDVCNKEGHANVRLPEPWQAEQYRFRLRHVPTRKVVELAISLN